MRHRQIIALVDMEELEADAQVQAVMLKARWVYFHPSFVFVPSEGSPFLRDDSNIKAKTPTRRP